MTSLDPALLVRKPMAFDLVPQFDGPKIFMRKIREDHRGYFEEIYKSSETELSGFFSAFAQINHSRSLPGVVRGLHYQSTPSQGKLIRVIRGRIFDVAVDLRRNSATFGRHFSIELSDHNGIALWIPPGFAHGFSVLGDEAADVMYKVNEPYNPSTEGGIRFDDPELDIDWPLPRPILSEKDMALPSFRDYARRPLF